MGWVVARITLALTIAGVLGYRWHLGWLSWPLILMCAFISLLLLLEILTADRPRRRATDSNVPAADKVDADHDGLTS